jgi:hypothetical protein
MATLSHEFVQQDKSRLHHQPEETLHRLTLYLQSIGLPQDRAAELAEQVAREVRDSHNEPPEDVTSAAIDRAMERVSHWLDEIAASGADASGEMRLQLLWFLRPVLTRHPDAFADGAGVREAFREAIRAADRPILPPPSPMAMPAQPLGELPRLWYRLAGYGGLIWQWLAQALNREG